MHQIINFAENYCQFLNKNKLMNLFDTLNEALTEEVVSKIAKLSDEEPAKTRKALDGIFYTLVAGLVRRTGSMMSVNMLFNQIQKGNQGGELIGDISSYLNKKEKLDNILKIGDGLISQIFPAYKSPLVSMIGIYAGIKKNSSTMYSSLAAPILIDAVSREMSTNKLDVDGLITFLSDHHEPLFKLVPEDLLEKMIPQLGLQELLSPKFSSAKRAVSVKPAAIKSKSNAEETIINKPSPTTPEPDNEEEESSTSPSSIKWVVVGLVAIVLLGGGYYWYKNYYEPSQGIQGEEQIEMDSSAIQPDTITKAIIDSVAIKDSLNAAMATPASSATEPTNTLEASLDTYISDKTKPVGQIFPMTNLAFIKGSQALDSKSESIIDALAALLNKYPKLQIQIQGHSNDAVGMDNKTMATKRAFAIKKRLLSKGITDTRIDAIGNSGSSNSADIKVVSK